METSSLTKEKFWLFADALVLANPRDDTAMKEAEVIRAWIADQSELAGHVLFRTSGSSGKGKWVALSKSALLDSARAVNDFLEVTSDDRWLQTLSLFHVGGMGIAARSYVAGCEVVDSSDQWDAERCHQLLTSEKISLTSMVPAQLADLVRLGKSSPEFLRSIVIGGGRLDDEIYTQAIGLGWPVQESYGMTETASQIATARAGERELCLLPSWEVSENAEGCLQMRGDAMFTGYIGCGEDDCFIEDPKHDGWFDSNDRGSVSGTHLTIQGRADRCVKILGELVDLNEVEQSIYATMKKMGRAHQEIAVMAVAPPEAGVHQDTRRGVLLVVCVVENKDFAEVLECFNADCHPLHRIKGIALLESFPRTGIGKISYPSLESILKSEK